MHGFHSHSGWQGVHPLFNLLALAASLFFSSLHCSQWFIQSQACCLPPLSLGRACYCRSVGFDSMYPEKVRTLLLCFWWPRDLFLWCFLTLWFSPALDLSLGLVVWDSDPHLSAPLLPVTFYLVTFWQTPPTVICVYDVMSGTCVGHSCVGLL